MNPKWKDLSEDWGKLPSMRSWQVRDPFADLRSKEQCCREQSRGQKHFGDSSGPKSGPSECQWAECVVEVKIPDNSDEPYSGIFPCFFGGFLSRLVCSISRASINFLRVSRGWMTASTNPRSAAT